MGTDCSKESAWDDKDVWLELTSFKAMQVLLGWQMIPPLRFILALHRGTRLQVVGITRDGRPMTFIQDVKEAA